MAVAKSTSLFPFHQKHGAKMTVFQGVRMPLFYRSIEADYNQARLHCGVTDLGCYNLLRISGESAREFLGAYCSTDIANVPPGKIKRLLFTREDGEIIAMPMAIFIESFIYLLVSPGTVDQLVDALADEIPNDVDVEPFNDSWTTMALIGPDCDEVLKETMRGDYAPLEPGEARAANIYTASVILASTRLFGEPANLIITSLPYIDMILERILDQDESIVRPIGIAALDMMRVEEGAVYPEFEARSGIMPGELGLMDLVDFSKTKFRGRQAIFEASQDGRGNWLIGFVMKDPMIPRRLNQIMLEGNAVGQVTSGSYSPHLQAGIGLGIVTRAAAINGNEIQIVRNQREFTAEIVSRPIHVNPKSSAMHKTS